MTGRGGTAPAARPPQRATAPTDAVVLRRSDFRESSRIVTCLTRDQGRVTALAKGAHRADSTFLGRIDFLNELRATFGPDRGGLRLFVRADLVRERRGLRAPRRFLAASHLAQLCEFAMPDERPEPRVFELLVGGLALLERCPDPALAHVLLGLELRHLAAIGALPDLDHCAGCGTPLGEVAFRNEGDLGLYCRRHAGAPRQPIGAGSLALLRELHRRPGREWPQLAATSPARLAAPLPALWLAAATEQRSRLRALFFEQD